MLVPPSSLSSEFKIALQLIQLEVYFHGIIKIDPKSWAWWCASVTPAFGSLRQEDWCDWPAWATEDPVSKNPDKQTINLHPAVDIFSLTSLCVSTEPGASCAATLLLGSPAQFSHVDRSAVPVELREGGPRLRCILNTYICAVFSKGLWEVTYLIAMGLGTMAFSSKGYLVNLKYWETVDLWDDHFIFQNSFSDETNGSESNNSPNSQALEPEPYWRWEASLQCLLEAVHICGVGHLAWLEHAQCLVVPLWNFSLPHAEGFCLPVSWKLSLGLTCPMCSFWEGGVRAVGRLGCLWLSACAW